MAANGAPGMNHTTQWLFGMLLVVFIGLISYVWVDRESRLADIERRVELREQAWHQARYTLQERIGNLEHEVLNLKARLRPERQEER
jgi:hypothetical protein